MGDLTIVTAILEQRQTATGRFYRPELDVLRFFAFLLVFLSHTIPQNHLSPHWLIAIKAAGALGVPVFFALSAYLITELLLRERAQTGSINIKSFYVRRVLRIWPLYFLVLFSGFIIAHWTPEHSIFSIRTLLSYIFLIGNWNAVIHGGLPLGLGALWSISVEEQFYLILPSLVKRALKKTVLLLSCAGWLSSQIAVLAMCYFHVKVDPGLWINSLTHLQYFAIGAATNIFLNGSYPKIKEPIRYGMIFLGICAFFIATFSFNIVRVYSTPSTITTTYPGYLLTNAAILLIFLGFIGSLTIGKSIWLRYMGKISYGLYIYHGPCVLLSTALGKALLEKHSFLMNFIVGFPLSVIVSSISYRYFETPFLRLKEHFEIVKSRSL